MRLVDLDRGVPELTLALVREHSRQHVRGNGFTIPEYEFLCGWASSVARTECRWASGNTGAGTWKCVICQRDLEKWGELAEKLGKEWGYWHEVRAPWTRPPTSPRRTTRGCWSTGT